MHVKWEVIWIYKYHVRTRFSLLKGVWFDFLALIVFFWKRKIRCPFLLKLKEVQAKYYKHVYNTV